MLIVWPAKDHAIVILVDRHDGSGNDIYGQLLDALDVAVPADGRDKPPCCDGVGQPPADSKVATQIADEVEARMRRRGR